MLDHSIGNEISNFSSPLFGITHAKLQEGFPQHFIIAMEKPGFLKRRFVTTPEGFDLASRVIDGVSIVAVSVPESIFASACIC